MSFPNYRAVCCSLLLMLTGICTYAQPQYRGKPKRVENPAQAHWVDSVYEALTVEERIGQLFMVQAYSGGRDYNEDAITALLQSHQIGGIIFSQGGPARQAILTNKYQAMAQVPLLIAMDAEWGVGMRLDSVKPFPRQMMMGATHDTALMARMGTAIAAQCKRLGMHIDFAPDVDVNNEPSNPVINSRSFGEDKVWVARMGRAYVRGLQQHGIIACAKHFPGHGNTSTDSHSDLPYIPRTLAQLDSVELYPFRQVIAEKVKSIMVAHLEVPSIDSTPHLPTSLSPAAVTHLLRDKLHYDGLVITDGLNMQGVTKYFSGGEAELRAFMAGNDILLMSKDVPLAITRIKAAIDSGLIPEIMLAHSVRKILAAKYDAGLTHRKDVDPNGITADLNKMVDSIRAQAARASLTLVRDENGILKHMNSTMRVGYIGVNASGSTPLYEALEEQFDNIKPGWLPKGSSQDSAQKLLESIGEYGTVIVGVHKLNFTPGGNYGLGDEAIAFLQQAACQQNVMIVLLGNAYAMQYFCGAGSIMVGYEDDTITEQTAAKALFRKLKLKGKLPVTACQEGVSICPAPARPLKVTLRPPSASLRHVLPVSAGVVSQQALDKLDNFIARCLADGVFPGCRILAAKNGNIFYDGSFGYLDYYKEKKVDAGTMYDMASCTKVLATTISVMKLWEQGKLDLDKTIGDYLPQARGTNKADLRIRDLLLHQAGLKSWIPFYKEVVDEQGKILPQYVRSTAQAGYTLPLARNEYLRNDFVDTMWAEIYDSKLDNKGKMVYSDLDFYFMAAIVKAITGKTIDKYAEETFYKPMGLKHTLYNPIGRVDTSIIAPTAIDKTFRTGELRGYVHDPGAAMLGGVGGHAGLFSTAHDVAVIFQMLLNKGSYGGKQYLKPETVDKFTAYGSAISHRALGFDKPLPETDDAGPAGERCSALAFGHQGFTGTCVWADPATGVVFVFLSNRVYPTSANNKITKLGVRTVSQDYIYEALGIPVNKTRPDMYKLQLQQK